MSSYPTAPAVSGGAGAATFNSAAQATTNSFQDDWLDQSGGILGLGSGDFGTYGFQMQVASGVIAGVGDYMAGQNQAAALKTQADFTTFQAAENLKRAGVATSELQERTGTELEQVGAKANTQIGQQRAAYSSQGVVVNTGTAATEQSKVGQLSTVDSLTTLNNAALEAFGIETQAIQTSGSQTLEAMGEKAQGTQSILTGGAQAFNNLAAIGEESQRNRAYFGR